MIAAALIFAGMVFIFPITILIRDCIEGMREQREAELESVAEIARALECPTGVPSWKCSGCIAEARRNLEQREAA